MFLFSKLCNCSKRLDYEWYLKSKSFFLFIQNYFYFSSVKVLKLWNNDIIILMRMPWLLRGPQAKLGSQADSGFDFWGNELGSVGIFTIFSSVINDCRRKQKCIFPRLMIFMIVWRCDILLSFSLQSIFGAWRLLLQGEQLLLYQRLPETLWDQMWRMWWICWGWSCHSIG